MFRRLSLAALSAALLCPPAFAQLSAYNSMSVAGDWQGWHPEVNNLYLISDRLWEGVFFISHRPKAEFKFAANGNWTLNWGPSAPLSGSVPLTNVAATASSANNIAITNVTDGFYRFRFNETSKVFSVELLAYVYQGPGLGNNLIRNGDFEFADPANTNEPYAWKWRSAMAYGDRFGNSGWVDWRYHSPFKQMFVAGGYQDFGGMWQDVPVGEDLDYELSGWFWMDDNSNTNYGPWTSQVQEIKFEFFDATRATLISSVSSNIPFTGESFSQTKLLASAPSGAAWARAVVNVNGAGGKGTLQIDDISMRVIPHSYQNFTSWNFTNAGVLTRGGWYADKSSVETNLNLAYALPSLSISNGGSLRSPYLEEGIQRIEFRYRNSAITTNDVEEAPADLNAQVRVSPTGEGDTFQTVATLSGISQQGYVLFSADVPNGEDQHVLEIRVTAGTNRFLLDNVSIMAALPPVRSQSFSAWTNAAHRSNGCYAVDGWQLCTGRVFDVGAYEAPSAFLPPNTNSFNYLQSPLLEEGYGEIALRASRGTNGFAPATIWVQESADGISWSTVGVHDEISDPQWDRRKLFFYQPQPRYVRIVNASEPTAGSLGGTVLINEGFDEGLAAPDGWEFGGLNTYTTTASSGISPPSMRFDTTGDYLVTEDLMSPTNIQFWMKGLSLTGSYQFDVQVLVGESWTTIRSMTTISGSEITTNIAVTSAATRVRLMYTLKASGNIAVDDLVIRGAPVGGQPAQDLRIDDISIGLPSRPDEFRSQDFTIWPTKNQYASGEHVFQGWMITNAIVNAENGYVSQSLRLNSAVGNYLQSPVFYDGIGVISFCFAKWLTDNAPTLAVQYSTNNGVAWVTLTNLVVSNPSSSGYQKFEYLLNLEQPACVRLLHTAGVGRAMIDEVFISVPQPPADVSIVAYHEPAAPYTNDTVGIMAIVSPVYGASVTNLTAFYRIGTNGAFTARAMAVTNFTVYQTVTNLGPYQSGTKVQYYVRAQFSGPGSSGTSPRFYPVGGSNDPTFFAVPRSPPGRVWINEIKYDTSFYEGWGLEFVELAGSVGFNISGWSIEVLGTDYFDPSRRVMLGRYVIRDGTFLPTTTPDLGFWVLGADGIDNANMLMTNSFSAALPAGVRLLNDGGAVEQALSFGGQINGYMWVPLIDDPFDWGVGLSLVGEASNYDGFAWLNDISVTPGAMNDGQQYEGSGSAAPDAWVEQMIWSTNITVITAGNTNQWTVTPWYATELKSAAVWNPISPFNSSYANGTNTIWFARPAATNYFIRVQFDQP